MKLKSNNVGRCPFCNNEGTLDYGAVQLEGEMCYFPWTCSECKNQGEEWYVLDFVGHNVYNKDGECIEIKDNMIEKDSE